MSDNSEADIATADALTLLLHNQHALAAAIEEVTKWLSESGVGSVADNAMIAMETLDTNAHAITDAIIRIRKSQASSSFPCPSKSESRFNAGIMEFCLLNRLLST